MTTPIEITPEFKQALHAISTSRHPVLITGSAGTGKSTLLRHYCESRDSKTVVLAPTGVAALNVGGQTIHRFFSFGIDVTPDTIRTEKVRRFRKNRARLYKALETVIVDEASMLRADLLDCVDAFLRRYGPYPGEAFGGVHMVFIGDLYQLPPVVTGQERDTLLARYRSPHFFNAKSLKSADLNVIELTQVFRQSDRQFIDILHRVRNNQLAPGDLDVLNTRVNPAFRPPGDQQYITLTGTNRAASDINDRNLAALPGKPRTSQAAITGNFTRESYPTDPELNYKAGAQIMMLNNDPKQRWVNGSLATIDKVHANSLTATIAASGKTVRVSPHNWEMIRFALNDDAITSETVGTFTQYPFRLAWAVTVHKSQGKTFDRMLIDLDRVFASGQTYVALSRCTSLEGMVLARPLKPNDIRCDFLVRRFLSDKHKARPSPAQTAESLFSGVAPAAPSGPQFG